MVSTIKGGVHRLSGEIVNSYLVEEAGSVTIVDAGVPSYWRLVPDALAKIGRSMADVRAILLTHGHADHTGFAERARQEQSWRSWVHEADAPLARGEVANPTSSPGTPTRLRPIAGFLWFATRSGYWRTAHLGEVATFGDGATLDVPGAPRVIHVPGHTPGSAALVFDSLGVVMTGDALVTYSVTSGRQGAQINPFTADRQQALASLDRLRGIDGHILLPGHGPAWAAGVDRAIADARAAEAGKIPLSVDS